MRARILFHTEIPRNPPPLSLLLGIFPLKKHKSVFPLSTASLLCSWYKWCSSTKHSALPPFSPFYSIQLLRNLLHVSFWSSKSYRALMWRGARHGAGSSEMPLSVFLGFHWLPQHHLLPSPLHSQAPRFIFVLMAKYTEK